MSQQNIASVERVNASFAAGNTEGFLDECTENVVWTMVGEKVTEGKAAIREWMAHCEGVEPPVFSVDKIIADNDSVVCYGDMTMKGEDGVADKYSYCDLYTFTGGKISDLRSFVVKHKTEGELSEKAAG